MYLDSGDSSPAMSKRLSLRIAIFGAVTVVLFAILFLRLWYLQVASGDENLAEANNNRTREFRDPAPRGDILDRNGEVLVENRTSLALLVNPRKLPEPGPERREELAQLGALANMPLSKVRRTMKEQLEIAAGAPVTLKSDVGHDLVYYLQENQDDFPGVEVQPVFVRRYPMGSLAAHVLGSEGEIEEDELKEDRYDGVQPGDRIGKAGVEDTYDEYLRGTPGITRIQVNALGEPTPGGSVISKSPVPGDTLKLSIDAKVQAAGEQALAAKGLPGAFVTMNIHNGQILGMGSFGTFDPTVFTKPLTQAQVNAIVRDPVAAPLTNRATQGLYPTGSTFKIITALAALENDLITPSTTIVDGGYIVVGEQKFQNAGGASFGPVDLVSALRVSSDVYFYELGREMWNNGELQHWAHLLGIGRPSGIDLPEQEIGLLPTKQWRNGLFRQDKLPRPWSVGDNIQLATGQGDLQSNPLQMAIAYAMLGNGGSAVTPHVGMEVLDPAGRVVREFEPPIRRHVHIDPGSRSAILEGLHEAAQSPGGTSYGWFGGFPVPVAGKTGTVQRDGYEDQSWYVVLAPFPKPRIVTAVTIEQGGFGADSAAPAALRILEAYFGKQATETTGVNGGSPG